MRLRWKSLTHVWLGTTYVVSSTDLCVPFEELLRLVLTDHFEHMVCGQRWRFVLASQEGQSGAGRHCEREPEEGCVRLTKPHAVRLTGSQNDPERFTA